MFDTAHSETIENSPLSALAETSQRPHLSVVFLNFNRIEETRHTVAQLRRILEHRQDVEVIAVDNGSQDGTAEFLQTQSDFLKYIQTDDNLGIAGYNQGFAKATGDYILVLDDDSYPYDAQSLDLMVDYLDTHPEVGLVACRIETPEGEAVMTWHLPEQDKAGNSLAFIGCGFIIRRELFEQIGWYPEDFFLYQNEIEVAIQVRRAGFEIYYYPQCRVVHRGLPSDRPNWRRVYYPTRNTIWLLRRYASFPSGTYLILSRLFIGLVRAIQGHTLSWYFRAVKEAFLTPIKACQLSPQLRYELKPFWQQNNLYHQVKLSIAHKKIQHRK